MCYLLVILLLLTYYILLINSAGNVYFADGSNECIRKVTISTAKISSFAGSSAGSGYTGDGGDATSATLNCPWGVVLDSAGSQLKLTSITMLKHSQELLFV